MVRLQEKLSKLIEQQKTMTRATERKTKIIQEEEVSGNHRSCSQHVAQLVTALAQWSAMLGPQQNRSKHGEGTWTT